MPCRLYHRDFGRWKDGKELKEKMESKTFIDVTGLIDFAYNVLMSVVFVLSQWYNCIKNKETSCYYVDYYLVLIIAFLKLMESIF